MNDTREKMWRALPFVMAMLLATLLPFNAQALFGGGKKTAEETAPDAPIAQDMEIRAYRGVAYTGRLAASGGKGDTIVFRVVTAPRKGTLELGEEGLFVYTPDQNKAGTDSFTYTAEDENGGVSAEATVKIRIERVSSGVSYSDTEGRSCATAAVDLAEHGVLVGAQVGGEQFFEPDRAVSRGEFIAMAMTAAGLSPSDVTVTGFCDDAAIPTWAKGSAAGALSAGVVRGVPTEEGIAFDADREMTLSEAATVLNRILKVTDVDLGATEIDEPRWYAQSVANLESVSIVPAGGFGEEALSHSLTRGEAAELLSSAMALAEARTQNSGALGFLGRIF